ncbi:MAG: hypothetical protein K2J32_12360, partial [Ruminococcus sp.]|nr:hypothetical protein [Ruminococcus sp.]
FNPDNCIWELVEEETELYAEPKDELLEKISIFSEYFENYYEQTIPEIREAEFFDDVLSGKIYIRLKENEEMNIIDEIYKELLWDFSYLVSERNFSIKYKIEIPAYFLAVICNKLSELEGIVSLVNDNDNQISYEALTYFYDRAFERLNIRWHSLTPLIAKISKTIYFDNPLFALFIPNIKPTTKDLIINNHNYTIIEKNAQLEKSIADKNNILNSFAHTYKNMKATALYDMGKVLLTSSNKDIRYYGRVALSEYSIKKNLTKQIDMMRLLFEDNIQELIKKISNTVYNSPDKSTILINNIVSEAWKRCFMTMLYDNSREAVQLREMYFDNDEDSKNFRDEFETYVIVNINDTLSWISETEIFDLKLSISGLWNNLYFVVDEYAALLLTEWLSEFFKNIMKYADNEYPIYIEFSSENNNLIIHLKNHKNTDITSHTTQQGIKSIKNFLDKLNEKKENINSINIIQTDDEYEVTLKITSDIFMKGIQ